MKVVDTDDPEDILLCGTEVIGSCFHVNSSNTFGELGKYEFLLAYLLYGQVRMVAVKNPVTNELHSRAMIRILYNERNESVLFQEKTYGSESDQEYLNEMCEQRAKDLGIPLVRYNEIDDRVSLNNDGAVYPKDYVDTLEFSLVGKKWNLSLSKLSK